MSHVVWAEESKNGLRFEIRPSYDAVPTTSLCLTDAQSSCMRNRARKCFKLFLESDLFGIIPKKSKTTNFWVILCLTHDLLGLHRKAQVCHLIPGNWRSFHSPFVVFFRSIYSTFNNKNHYAKFQDLN